jgi:hypothetical protein
VPFVHPTSNGTTPESTNTIREAKRIDGLPNDKQLQRSIASEHSSGRMGRLNRPIP